MMQRKSTAVRFLTGNEAEMVEVINFNGARFDSLIAYPEYMGKVGEAFRGSLAINKLTGMPVIAAPYTMNGVTGLLVADSQMECFRAMKEKGASSSILHEGINAAGKVLPAFEGFDEVAGGGRFAGFGNSTSHEDAAYGALTFMRDGKLTVDNSLKYIYQEIMNINGDIDQQQIPEESARALFKSGLTKANEALNSLKGDGLRTALRRSVAIETFMMFMYKANTQAFTQGANAFQQAIRQEIMNNKNLQTTTMLDLEAANLNGTELLKNIDMLSKVIVEEAELSKEIYFNTASGSRPVNQIDEAFIYELLETLADPSKPSMSQAILNAETFSVDAIQAGAKMVGRLDKLAKGSIKTYSDIVPFFPTMPRGESEEVIINKFSAWLSQAFNQDMSQLPFHYFNAKGNNGSFTDNKNGAFFGMGNGQQGNGGPQTLSDAIFGTQNGNQNGQGGFNNNGNLKGAFDSILNKLGGTQQGFNNNQQNGFGNNQGFNNQGNSGFGQNQQNGFGNGSFGGGLGFGGNGTFGNGNQGFSNQQGNNTSGYADGINNMLKGNQGGNGMWFNNNGFGNQGNSFGNNQGFGGAGFGQQQQSTQVFITLNGVDYMMDTAQTEATPHGVAARVFNANGQIVGGALADGRCMDMSYAYVGTASLKQQNNGWGQQQGGFGNAGFGGNGFGQQQNTGFGGNTGWGNQGNGFGNAGFGQQGFGGSGFGGNGLRANPVNQGFGRTMQMI